MSKASSRPVLQDAPSAGSCGDPPPASLLKPEESPPCRTFEVPAFQPVDRFTTRSGCCSSGAGSGNRMPGSATGNPAERIVAACSGFSK